MASCRSDQAEQIKRLLTMQEVAEVYGFHPNRAGFIHCPFHEGDHQGSLKLYPEHRGWHCFGCGKGGSVIDFVMYLFDLSFPQAILRINMDFHLGLNGVQRMSHAEKSKLLEARRREAERKAAFAQKYKQVAVEFLYCHEITKYFPPALLPDGTIYFHPFYPEAVKKLPQLEAWLDENLGR